MTKKNTKRYGLMHPDKETARQLGWSVQHLWNRRSRGQAVPDYVKYGPKNVRTPQSAIDEFIEAHLISA